jgi:hypothetical protein
VTYPQAVIPRPNDTRCFLEDALERGQLIEVTVPREGTVFRELDSAIERALKTKGLAICGSDQTTREKEIKGPDQTQFVIGKTSSRAATDKTFKVEEDNVVAADFTATKLKSIAKKSKLQNALADTDPRSKLPLFISGKSCRSSD